MSLDLHGKVALVTASSEGLGFACAEHLAAEGCALALCARRSDRLELARAKLEKNNCNVFAVIADLTIASDIENLIAKTKSKFGRIDILVINSGHIDYGSLEDLTDLQWQSAYDLLLMSVVRLIRAVVPAMRANKVGDIVILSSSTVKEPPPHLILSSVMRLGVVGLAKTLARSLAPDNIRVNIVAAGYFDTGRVHNRVRALMADKDVSYEAAANEISGNVPVGRIGTPKEFAELVAFVASRKAGFMTGSMITIDGGGSRAVF